MMEENLNEVISFLQPWPSLWLTLDLLAPLLGLALFVALLLASMNTVVQRFASDQGRTSFFIVFVSTAVFSMMGVIFGMMIQLIGGFSALLERDSGDLVSGLVTMLLVFFGVGSSLLSEARVLRSGNLDKPLASLAFMICFVASGFFWKMLTTIG